MDSKMLGATIQGCSFLASEDSVRLCDYLSNEIGQLKTSPLVVAGLSLLSALLIAISTWYGNKRSQQTERHNKSQREAIIDLQNTALELRNYWIIQLEKIISDSEKIMEVSSDETKLIGEFKTKLIRIDRDHVRNEYNKWFNYGQELFHNAEDSQEYMEDELWNAALECSGNNLRSLDK